MNLTYELLIAKDEILNYAHEYKLDPFPTYYELIDYDEVSEVASYGGFPTRYPHWRFGMEYQQLSTSYEYGLQKIYELVINNNPCYAYLMKGNSTIDQKLVIAHVYGHSDFFKNNLWFSKTNRKMIDEMANHSTRIRKYIDKFGLFVVEEFIDKCLSIENLIDPHSVFVPKIQNEYKSILNKKDTEYGIKINKLKSKQYMDKYINPPDFIEKQKEAISEAKALKIQFPDSPQRDVLQFLIEYAPIQTWERDILATIREEAYYFAPQGMTKIMNEGWASYWHSKIMTRKVLTDAEFIDYADHHSGTMSMSPGSFNPYKIGIELFRDIEDRWNKGKFGKEYDECNSLYEKKNWNLHLNKGMQKIFDVRMIYNDVTFIDEFLTKEFCEKHKLFVYDYDEKKENFFISDRDYKQIKQTLLFKLTNMGQPIIDLLDANYDNKSELLLGHKYEGVEIYLQEAQNVLQNIFYIWKRPVNMQTVINKKEVILRYDGNEFQKKE